MSVTMVSNHLPCLSQFHITSNHVCLTCTYNHACLIHLHRTSIHICYSNILPSVLSVALAQTSIVVMVVTIATNQQACFIQLQPTISQDCNEHLQRADILLRYFCCVATLYSFIDCSLFFFVIYSYIHIQISS